MAEKRKVSLDIVLIAVIILSIGFIGYKIRGNSGKTPTATVPLSPPVPAAETQPKPTLAAPAPNSVSPDGNFQTKLKPVSDADWAAFIQKSSLAKSRVQETPKCAEGLPETKTRGFLNPVFIPVIKAGNLRTMLIARRLVCFKVGTEVSMLIFDRSIDAPVVQFLGTSKIAELYYPVRSMIPDDLFAILGTTREAYVDFVNQGQVPVEGSDKQYENVVRFAPFQVATKMPSLPIPGLPRGLIINRDDLKVELAKDKGAILVDVRSEEEFKKGSLPGAINAPYLPSAEVGTKFKWDVKNRDLTKSNFAIAKLLPNKTRRMFVFGNDARDSRAFYAAIELNDAQFPSVGWIYDGVTGTDKAP